MRVFLLTSLLSLSLGVLATGIMSKFGTMVCPILRSHGFWEGCDFYVRAFIFIALYNFLCSLVLVKVRSRVRRSFLRLNLPFHIMYTIGYGFLVAIILPEFLKRVAETGTPYTPVLKLMFLAILITTYSLIVKLNDYLMVVETFDGAQRGASGISNSTHWMSEYYHLILGFLTPLICMGLFTGMVVEAMDQGSSWIDSSRRVTNILIAAAWMIGWFVLYSFFDFLKKEFVIQRLRQKAVSLGQKNKLRDLCLDNLDGLFEVGKALNQSSQTIKEKKRLLQGFTQFVSPRVAEKVLNEESIENQTEQRTACVFMIDLRNFTETSRKLNGDDLVRWLNAYYECLTQHFEIHDIILDKFIGDGVLAYTLSEQGGEVLLQVRETAEALIQLFAKVEKVSADIEASGLPSIEIGIGAHYGNVMIGMVGAKNRKQYTIIGNPVNKASRLESLCKTYSAQFVISEEVHKCLAPEVQKLFDCDSNASIKGLDGPQKVYFSSLVERSQQAI